MFKNLLSAVAVMGAASAKTDCDNLVEWEHIADDVVKIAASATSSSARVYGLFLREDAPVTIPSKSNNNLLFYLFSTEQDIADVAEDVVAGAVDAVAAGARDEGDIGVWWWGGRYGETAACRKDE